MASSARTRCSPSCRCAASLYLATNPPCLAYESTGQTTSTRAHLGYPLLWQTPKLGVIQILIFIAFIEVIGILNTRRADYEPGNFLGSSQWETGETWENYQLKELNNGRLAMFGSIGMLVGSYITGKGPIEVFSISTVVF